LGPSKREGEKMLPRRSRFSLCNLERAKVVRRKEYLTFLGTQRGGSAVSGRSAITHTPNRQGRRSYERITAAVPAKGKRFFPFQKTGRGADFSPGKRKKKQRLEFKKKRRRHNGGEKSVKSAMRL